MKTRRRFVLATITVGVNLILSARVALTQPTSPSLSFEQIEQIVRSPDRSTADRTNDLRRKPEQMLSFIGIRPGMIALDLSAAGGYTTELLARAIGPSGTVWASPRKPTNCYLDFYNPKKPDVGEYILCGVELLVLVDLPVQEGDNNRKCDNR
jgi:hypothetical protein